jgi:hypothetical protein
MILAMAPFLLFQLADNLTKLAIMFDGNIARGAMTSVINDAHQGG